MPWAVSFTPIFRHNIDPTYFWFRPVHFLSPWVKILLRCGLLFALVVHCALLDLGFPIIMCNTGLYLSILLNSATKLHKFHGKKLSKFARSFLEYRKIQILTTLTSNFHYYVVSIGLFLAFLASIALSCLVIRMTYVPIPLTIFSIVILALDVGLVHVVLSMFGDIYQKSVDFRWLYKSKNLSLHQVKQVRSCNSLKIYIGSVDFISKRTRIIYFSQFLECTISLLICT